jgi:hypothetical protein
VLQTMTDEVPVSLLQDQGAPEEEYTEEFLDDDDEDIDDLDEDEDEDDFSDGDDDEDESC